MRHSHFALAGGIVLASLLAACGGGNDDPSPTSLDSLLTISSATNASVNGVYSTGATGLSNVDKENPIDTPQFCAFRFNSLVKADNQAVLLDGRVAYNVNQELVNNFQVSVSGVTYGTGNPTNTFVDKAAHRVTVNSKVLTSEIDGVSTVTVTASIPMVGNRPAGC